jgi:histone chaperone ASF1
MAAINLLDVMVLNAENAPFLSGFAFQITFECVTKLRGELEWRVVYVGSAKSESLDQELDSVLVGPVPLGVSRFVLDVPAPDPSKIPSDDLLGATAIMITCSYGGKEFVKVGYWVSNSPKNPPPEGTNGRCFGCPLRVRAQILKAAVLIPIFPLFNYAPQERSHRQRARQRISCEVYLLQRRG